MSPEKENNSILKLFSFPKKHQEHSSFFIARGREHFSAACRLMQLPALGADGAPLKLSDGTVLITPEYLPSSLILYQLSFELLIKSLIKLKEKKPPKNGKKGHDLQYLLSLATEDFPALSSIQEQDRKILEELSSVRKESSNLMRLKYGKSGLSLPKGKKPLLDSLFRIYQLLNGEIQTFVSQQPEAKETD